VQRFRLPLLPSPLPSSFTMIIDPQTDTKAPLPSTSQEEVPPPYPRGSSRQQRHRHRPSPSTSGSVGTLRPADSVSAAGSSSRGRMDQPAMASLSSLPDAHVGTPRRHHHHHHHHPHPQLLYAQSQDDGSSAISMPRSVVSLAPAPTPPLRLYADEDGMGEAEKRAAEGRRYQEQLLARCANGVHNATYTYGPAGIITAVLLFPVGLLCLLVDREKKCTRCGELIRDANKKLRRESYYSPSSVDAPRLLA